jgi:hypothetical protein
VRIIWKNLSFNSFPSLVLPSNLSMSDILVCS